MEKQSQILMRACPICNSRSGHKLLDINFENQKGNPLPEHYDVIACDGCGFTYSDMSANQSLFNQYYSKYNTYAEAERIRVKESEKEPRFVYIAELIKGYVSLSAEILDVGCGGGELLEVLKQDGFDNVCGLDPSKESIKQLTENGIKGILGNIFDKKTVEKNFDVVISTAVAEHIYDLNRYIRNLGRYLKNDGFLVINVPAVENFPHRMAPLAANFNQEHINYFSKVSLDNLFGVHGFSRCHSEPYMNAGNDQQLVTIYKRQNGAAIEIKYDFSSEDCIKKYIVQYQKIQDETDEKVRIFLSHASSFVIFGAGSYAMQLLKRFPELSDKTLFFVDNNSAKHEMLLAGKKIKPVEALKDLEEKTEILVCSMCNSGDIMQQVQELGIKNRIFAV